MSVITDPTASEPSIAPKHQEVAPRRLIACALAIAAILEIGLRGGVDNAVVTLAAALIIRLLWTQQRLAQRQARIIAIAGLVPALFLAIRTSPWLAWSNAAMLGALLLAAVLHARRGSMLDSTPAQLARRGLSGLRQGVASLAIVTSLVPDLSESSRDRFTRLTRALIIVVPVALVLVALLASADAVFASLLSPDIHPGPVLGHVVLTVLLAPVVVMLVGATSHQGSEPSRQGTFGAIEIGAMLGIVGAILTLFVVAQLVAPTDAGDRLIESAGLTPAEYARSGFFQLCWATGLLVAFLAAVRALADPSALRNRVVVVLGTAVPALAVGLVVVSLRRMALYDQAYGLTMLRLWVVGAAIWMGAVLIMTAARNLGLGSGRHWLVAGASLAAGVLLIAANLANPEAFVARHNLERANDGAKLDLGYLAALSDDAVPVVLDAIEDETDRASRDELRRALRCGDTTRGVASFNLAAREADEIRAKYCNR
jgi:two-component system sensor histidine kinase BaeS